MSKKLVLIFLVSSMCSILFAQKFEMGLMPQVGMAVFQNPDLKFTYSEPSYTNLLSPTIILGFSLYSKINQRHWIATDIQVIPYTYRYEFTIPNMPDDELNPKFFPYNDRFFEASLPTINYSFCYTYQIYQSEKIKLLSGLRYNIAQIPNGGSLFSISTYRNFNNADQYTIFQSFLEHGNSRFISGLGINLGIQWSDKFPLIIELEALRSFDAIARESIEFYYSNGGDVVRSGEKTHYLNYLGLSAKVPLRLNRSKS